MDQSACKLTLVYPPGADDTIIELMLDAEPSLSGFTTWLAEGHGHDFTNASARERVRGRVMRGVLTVVVPRTRLAAILEDVRTRAGIVNLVYWVEPVEAFGRLARVGSASAAACESAA
jgi:Protein of unknown function (DUF3240)